MNLDQGRLHMTQNLGCDFMQTNFHKPSIRIIQNVLGNLDIHNINDGIYRIGLQLTSLVGNVVTFLSDLHQKKEKK